MSDLSDNVTAFAVLITAVGTWRGIRKVEKEVKTMNSQTIAELADADETRRIDVIPEEDRTPLEKSHLKETKQ